MQIFERALLRAGYRSEFTQGFNPKPRIEFAQPLSLGITSEGETALAEIQNFDGEDGFIAAVNPVLPEGIDVVRARFLPPYQVGQKKRSLMSLYVASEYRIELQDPEEGDLSLLDRLGADARQGGGQQGQPADRPLVRVVAQGSDHLLIRISQIGRGSGNIFKVLKALGLDDENRTELSITRTQVFARPLDSSDPEAVSYFDLEL
jgi:radical SAM-linked protein